MGVATMKVPTIFTAIDRFSSVVDKMTKKTANFGAVAQASAMRTSRKFNEAGNSMLASGTVMAGGIGIAVNEAMKFEKSMANVSTTIDSTPASMRKMSTEVMNMAKKTPIPISQLTDALYDVVSAGIEAKDSMVVLDASSRLGVAGLGTAKEGVDVITSSLNSFNIKAEESERVANMVFKAVKYGKTTVSGLAESFGSSSALIKNSNVSLEEYLATTAVLTTTGMTASRAQTQVASATTALIKPSKAMSKILDSLGAKDIPEFIKQNGGLVKTMKLVSDRANKMGILTSKAFGRKEGYSAMLSLLGSLNGKFNEVMLDMTGNVDTLSEAFNKQKATASASFELLKNNATILAVKIGNQLLPKINAFAQRLIHIIDKLSNWAERNSWLINTILKVTVVLLALGAAAKIGSFIFFGLAKAIQFVNYVTKTASVVTGIYEGVMLTAALSGKGLVVVIGELAVATLATVAPFLLVAAAIGGLIYVLSDTDKSMERFTRKRLENLDKGNSAWKKSTSVMRDELNKQNSLLNRPKNIVGIEAYTHKVNADINNLYDKPVELPNIPTLQGGFKMPTSSSAASSPLNVLSKSSKTERGMQQHNALFGMDKTPKNLAGNDNQTISGKQAMGTNNVLKVLVDTKNGAQAEIDDSQMKGISVITTSSKKPSGTRYYLPPGY